MSIQLPDRPLRSSAFLALTALLLPVAGCSDGGGDEGGAPDPAGIEALGAGGDDFSPETASATELAGRAFQAAQAGQDDVAIDLFRRAIEKEPDVPAARFALGTLLVPQASAVMLGSSTIDYEILDEAIGHLEKAVELDPENAEYHYWLGRALDVRGREDDALVSLRTAVELDPEHVKAHKRIGLVTSERGDVEAARTAFERVVELDPTDAGTYYQLGTLALAEDPAEARDLFVSAIGINPKNAQAHHGLSQALAQLGDEEAAAEEAAVAERLQGHKDTLQRLEQLADAQPANVEAQFAAAEANFALQRYDRTATLLTRVVQLQPDHSQAHYYFGLIRMEQGDWTMAMNHFEESLYFAPDQIGPRVELIRVYEQLGNDQRIAELALELETMMGRGEVDAEVKNAVAEVFLEVGRREKALEYLRDVLAEDSENQIAAILLERAESEQ